MNRFGLGLADSMAGGLDFVLRGSLVLTVAWLLTSLLRRNTAAIRHAVWSMGLVAVIVLPLMQTFVPSWRVLPATDESIGESFATGDDFAIPPMISPDHPGHWPLVENAANDPGLMASKAARSAAQIAANSESNESTIAAIEAMEAERSEALAPSASAESSVVNETAAKPKAGSSVGPAVGMIWLIGVAVFCLPMVLGTARVWRLRRSSEPVPNQITDEVAQLAAELRVSRRVEIVLSGEREMPMTWGLFTPVLLLPASAATWSGDRRRMVVLHELAHIRRWDCLTQLLGQFARALHWFNPLAWLALHRMRIEQERACDDVVLNFGTDADEYAWELLSVTARLPRPMWDTSVALAMSRCSRIEQRLKSILDSNCERRPTSLRQFVATCGAMLVVVCGIAAAQRQVAVAADKPNTVVAQAAGADAKPAEAAKTELGFDNGDFEGDVQPGGYPASWHPAHLVETVQFLKFQVEDSGHGGKRSASIAIDKTHPAHPVAYNWLAMPRGWKAGQALEVSAWVKTENVKITPSLAVQCWGKDNNFLAIGSSYEKFQVTGTKDWTRIAALVLVPAETQQILVRAVLSMPGNGGAKVWFDDFEIAKANEADAKAATHELTPAEQAAVKQQDEAAIKASSDSLKQVLDKIAEVSPTPVDPKALNEAAIRGMLQSLKDPYSTLITAEQMKEFSQQLEGKLVGIGAMLKKEGDEIEVTGLVPNSPAMRGGLKPRDVIVEINGQPAKDLVEAVKSIRGQAGTEVTLKVRRADKPESLTLKRGEVRIPAVKGFSLNDQGQWRHWLDADQKIGFVHLTMFDQATSNDLKETLTRLKEQGLKGLVLDLRGNGGGMLNSCVEVARLFLKEGTIVEVRSRPPHENSKFEVTAPHTPLLADVPLIVLVDPTTASAAEVLASALKDNNRATLLGERTFGKGSVQTIVPLGNEGQSLKLTVALMFSAGGHSLHRAADSKTWGVDPHDGYFVPLTTEQRVARIKTAQAREIGALKLPESVSPDFLDKDVADSQLAAALKSLLAKLKTGEFTKTGRPLADQDAVLTQRDDLRKQRDELRGKLEQLDRELGEGR